MRGSAAAISRSGFATCVAALLLTFAACAEVSAGARPPARLEAIRRAPGFASDSGLVIAVLPVATVDGDGAVGTRVGRFWIDRIPHPNGQCVDAIEGWLRVAASSKTRDSLRAVLAREVLADGPLDAEFVRLVATRYRANALLCLRVDRWESATGGVKFAYVDLAATLFDTAGVRLWSCRGSARGEGNAAGYDIPTGAHAADGGRGPYVPQLAGAPAQATGTYASGSSGGSGGGGNAPNGASAPQTPIQSDGAPTTMHRAEVELHLPDPALFADPFDAALAGLLSAVRKELSARGSGPARRD